MAKPKPMQARYACKGRRYQWATVKNGEDFWYGPMTCLGSELEPDERDSRKLFRGPKGAIFHLPMDTPIRRFRDA